MNEQNCRRFKLSALSLWVNLRNHGPELKQVYLGLYQKVIYTAEELSILCGVISWII